MPEIKKMKPTVTVAFDLDVSKTVMDPPTISLTLVPSDPTRYFDDQGEALQSSKVFNRVVAAVVGWDLILDGKPLECTEENKREYLRHLVGQFVTKDGIRRGLLFQEIFGICQNPESFLGN